MILHSFWNRGKRQRWPITSKLMQTTQWTNHNLKQITCYQKSQAWKNEHDLKKFSQKIQKFQLEIKWFKCFPEIIFGKRYIYSPLSSWNGMPDIPIQFTHFSCLQQPIDKHHLFQLLSIKGHSNPVLPANGTKYPTLWLVLKFCIGLVE